MSFHSHIYNRQGIENDSSDWPIFFLSILSGVLGYLLVDVSETLGTVIMIASIIGMYFYTYRNWGKKEAEGNYVGEIILTGDQFILNKETIKTSDIKELKIEIGHEKGYKHWHRHGYTVDSGTNSKLEFYIHGVKKQYNFQILYNKQVQDLKTVLEELYTKGIFVKEYYLGTRTYLLQNLDYEDIQEFKKKYKLR